MIQSAFQPGEISEECEARERKELLAEVDAELLACPMVTSFTRKKAAGSGSSESLALVMAPEVRDLRPVVSGIMRSIRGRWWRKLPDV